VEELKRLPIIFRQYYKEQIEMRYNPIDKSLYIKNRENLSKLLKSKSVCIFNANDIMPTNADGTMPFKQNTNLFYRSGKDQEETVLLLAPEFPDERFREILFLKETNEEIAIWEGHKYTKEEARDASGIQTIKWLGELDAILPMIMAETSHVYLDVNEHIRNGSEVQTRNDRFMEKCKANFPLHEYERAFPLLYQLRTVKSDLEIASMQVACNITDNGFRRILKKTKPGIWEFELEAEYLHEFVSKRSTGFAYTPIIASGASACVLHYIDNNKECKDGDLLLMDVGAEYGNYNADMTRCIPVNGKFSRRQKEVYEAVLRVKNEATNMLRPGTTIHEYHKEVGLLMQSELLKLGLIDKTDVKNQNKEWPAYKKYFMHGTSHHIGLDVHDVGSFYEKIEQGNVFTVEPGIYIREEGLGVRIEDDVVITADGYINLMKNIPIEVEEIESIMNS